MNRLEKPFGSLMIQDITGQAVYRFLQRLGAEGASHAYLSKIKGCLSLPYKWGRMALQLKVSDPTEGISLKGLSKKRETRVRVISAEEEQRFFEAAAGSVWYNFFRLLLVTGMRPSEAMGLQLVDLAEDGIHISRGYTRNGLSTLKTKNAARVFPWTTQLREIIANQKEQLRDLGISSIWLFPTESGQPSLNAATLAAKHYARQTAVWKRGGRNGQKKIIRLEDPIQLSLYDFRHTFATRAARVLPARTLQYLMGHATIAVTLRYYIDIEAEDLLSAAAILSATEDNLRTVQKKTNSARTS